MSERTPDKILVIDDDPIVRLIASKALGDAGFEVIEAAGGIEAMRTLTTCRPDLILLDVIMSGTDGFTLCREIRNSEACGAIPVLMITGLEDVDSINRAYEVGATDFITKPIQWPVLVHRIRHVIQASRTEQELAQSRTNYQVLFESNPHPMWVYDFETLAFLEVNEAAVRHYGYTREEFLARTIADIRPSEDVSRLSHTISGIVDGFNPAAIWRHCKKDGTLIDVEISSHTIMFAGRKCRLVLSNDITERLRSQTALAKSRQQFQILFEGVSDILYAVAPDGSFVALNSAFEAVTGWSRRDWIGRSFTELIHPDDLDLAKTLFREGLDGKAASIFELRTIGKSGEIVTIEGNLTPQVEGGKVWLLQGIARDLTHRRRVELELWRADRALRTVSDCNKALVYATDELGLLNEICRSIVANHGYRFAWVGYAQNDAIKSVTPMAKAGYDEGYLDEILVTWGDTETGRGTAGTAIRTGMPRVVRDVAADQDFAPWHEAALSRGYRSIIGLPLVDNGETFGALLICASDAGAFDDAEVELLKELASNLSYGIVALRVRREHRKAEKALKVSQAQLSEALRLAKLGYWCWNGKDAVSWGQDLYRLFELPPDTRPFAFAAQEKFFAAGSWELFRDAVRRTVEKGEKFQLDLEVVTATGATKWMTARGAPVRDREGAIAGAHGTCQDITEMKLARLAEAELQESLALLSRAVEQSPVSIVITDTEGKIEFVNPKFTQVTGYTFDEAIGQNPRILKSGEVPVDRYEEMWKILGSGQTWQGDFLNCKKNGELFLEVAAISPVKNREGDITHFVAVKEDITEHRKLEEQLRHAQKMEAIGTLAGGIAHDFNNILTTVMSYCALMDRKLDPADPLRGYVAKVVGAAERAASLTRGLLTYSRKEPTQTRPVNVNDLLVQTDHLLSKLLSEDIELRILPSETPLVVLADSVQLEQVVMNLASNARDAMVHGGSIEIRTAPLVLERDLPIASGRVQRGSYAVITVADDGTGMDAQTLARIFEPFYTTKEVGKGSGLGLSITYGIVNQHGGYIDVESEPGRGTTFTIYLPLTKREKSARQQPAPPAAEKGMETVLVVEDDRLIREIFREVLEEAGYQVISASDGEDGLRKFGEHRDRIQLVVLDVIMPKKNGVALYEEIKRDSPAIKALFISGYAADILSERALLVDQNVMVVPKPLTPNTLLCKVREVLDGRVGEAQDQAKMSVAQA